MEYQRGYTSCSVKMNIDAYCTSIVHRFLFRGFSYMFSFFFSKFCFGTPAMLAELYRLWVSWLAIIFTLLVISLAGLGA